MAGLSAPLSRLRAAPHGSARMTGDKHGSLLLLLSGTCRPYALPAFAGAIAVGMRITAHPPHGSRRAQLTHRALAGVTDEQAHDHRRAYSCTQRVDGACFSGAASGTCSTRLRFPRPLAFAPSTPHSSRACSPTSTLLCKSLTSPARTSLASARRLPNADRTLTARVAKLETSRFPGGMCIDMPGSLTTPGCSGTRDSAPMHVAFRRIRIRRHPRFGFFRGSMAGLSTPLSTLHATPHDAPRMTRGQRGSLLLGWRGLSPLTLRRFRRRTLFKAVFEHCIHDHNWSRDNRQTGADFRGVAKAVGGGKTDHATGNLRWNHDRQREAGHATA